MLVEHQLDAVGRVARALERFGGVILADEPGLGKSFIAAQVAADEERRGGSAEVIVPASLLGQWRATLREFGVDAVLRTHSGIVNDHFVPQPRPRLIVVDEAHAFRNAHTQRYDALARRSVGARMLLVTATPVCNAAADLLALVTLIVPDDVLAAHGVPSIEVAFATRDGQRLQRVVAELVIRRGQSVLPPRLRFGRVNARVVSHPVFTAAGEVNRLLGGLRFPLVGESALLRQFLWRRLESSESALLESLRRQRRFYERALECLASGRALPKSEYRRAFGREEDQPFVQQVLFWDLFAPEGSAADAKEIEEELLGLDALRACVARSPGAKRQLLLDICAATAEPMLVFTGWAATAGELFDALRAVRRAVRATGRERSRAGEAIEAFRGGEADVLVATDFAAEGLNLQRAATVVHYDLPWNPVRADQRNGRAHRIGQTRPEVQAIYFVPERDTTGVLRVTSAKNALRTALLAGEPPAVEPGAAGAPLPSRVPPDAACVRLAAALRRMGRALPRALARRHKAGVERLLAALSEEALDDRKLGELWEVLALERWGGGGHL